MAQTIAPFAYNRKIAELRDKIERLKHQLQESEDERRMDSAAYNRQIEILVRSEAEYKRKYEEIRAQKGDLSEYAEELYKLRSEKGRWHTQSIDRVRMLEAELADCKEEKTQLNVYHHNLLRELAEFKRQFKEMKSLADNAEYWKHNLMKIRGASLCPAHIDLIKHIRDMRTALEYAQNQLRFVDKQLGSSQEHSPDERAKLLLHFESEYWRLRQKLDSVRSLLNCERGQTIEQAITQLKESKKTTTVTAPLTVAIKCPYKDFQHIVDIEDDKDGE